MICCSKVQIDTISYSFIGVIVGSLEESVGRRPDPAHLLVVLLVQVQRLIWLPTADDDNASELLELLT